MVRYLTLITFTDQGIRDVHHTVERAAAFRTSVEAAGGQVVSLYWAIGEADGCAVFEAPDEETASALLLTLGQNGNVRTRTLRVYDENEFKSVLARV